MYRYGTLRPPTAKEMEDKWLELETIEVQWYSDTEVYCRTEAHEPAVSELIGFMIAYDIPVDARVAYGHCGSHTVVLDWREEAA